MMDERRSPFHPKATVNRAYRVITIVFLAVLLLLVFGPAFAIQLFRSNSTPMPVNASTCVVAGRTCNWTWSAKYANPVRIDIPAGVTTIRLSGLPFQKADGPLGQSFPVNDGCGHHVAEHFVQISFCGSAGVIDHKETLDIFRGTMVATYPKPLQGQDYLLLRWKSAA